MILILCCMGFLFYLFQSMPDLPLRVAVRFAGDGHATGWMKRSEYRYWMTVIGISLPLVLGLLGAVLCWLFSRRAYRESREGQPTPGDLPHAGVYLLRYSLWLGSWVACLIAGIQYFIVAANDNLDAGLSVGSLSAVGVTFLAGVVICIARLAGALRNLRNYTRPPVA